MRTNCGVHADVVDGGGPATPLGRRGNARAGGRPTARAVDVFFFSSRSLSPDTRTALQVWGSEPLARGGHVSP
jgi:hypothetical protein